MRARHHARHHAHARPREHADRKRKRGNGGVERNVQADAVSGEKEPEWYISSLQPLARLCELEPFQCRLRWITDCVHVHMHTNGMRA